MPLERHYMPPYLSLPRNSEQDFVERLNAISLSESRSLLNGYYFVPNADQFYDAQIGFTGPVQPLKP